MSHEGLACDCKPTHIGVAVPLSPLNYRAFSSALFSRSLPDSTFPGWEFALIVEPTGFHWFPQAAISLSWGFSPFGAFRFVDGFEVGF